MTEQEAVNEAKKLKGQVWHTKKLGWVYTFHDTDGSFVMMASDRCKKFKDCYAFLASYPKSAFEYNFSDNPPIAYQTKFRDFNNI